MGILGKLFKRDWRPAKAQGDRLRADAEPGLALQEYRIALKRFDGTEAERMELMKGYDAVRLELRSQHLERAAQLTSAGQLERARTSLESAHRLSDSDAERDELQGLFDENASLVEGEVEDPVAGAFAFAEEQDPDLAERDRFHILLGGLSEDQADHYESLGKEFRHGWVALQEGRLEHALEQLAAVHEGVPQDGYVMAELGRAHLAMDHLDEALDLLARADEREPESIYILLARVEALWAAKDYATAEHALQRAHDVDEENMRVFAAIGEHALRSGDHAPGIEAVELMLEHKPNDVSLLRMAAQLHHAKGDLDKALAYYEAVNGLRWSIDPDSRELVFDPVTALGAAQILLQQGRKAERIISLLHAMLSVTAGENQAQMHAGIARAHLLKKRKKDARAAYELALSVLPEDAAETRAELTTRLEAIT